MRATIEAAYRTHGPAVLRRARSITGNEADAHEIVQELFTSLLAKPEQFSGKGSLMGFLYRATTNLCLNRLRNARNRRRILDQQGPPEPSAPARAEVQTLAADYLRALPEDQAKAVVYYYIDEMSQAEIATLLGCSTRHVSNLLKRARTQKEPVKEVRP